VEEIGGNATKGCRKQHTKRPPNAEKRNTENKDKTGRSGFGRGNGTGPRLCPRLITLHSSCLSLDCLSLRLRMSLGSHCGLFAHLGHCDGSMLHNLDAERICIMDWFLVGVFLIELETVCFKWIQLDFTA
jgi:hypothetical protein